jgi:regulatory protein YycI of two-component signal transduction system YycFG
MDFKKIQIIFLIIFVSIDIFLFSLFHQSANLQTENNSKGSDTEIIKQMSNDQINVMPKLSTKNQDGYYLSALYDNSLRDNHNNLENQKTTYANHLLRSSFKRPIELNSGSYHQEIRHLMKQSSFMMHGDEYEYSSTLSTKNTVVFLQKNDYGTLYGTKYGKVTFDVNNDHLLVGYSQSYMSNVNILREKSDIISPAKALVWLYQYNEIPDNSKVIWVHLYYTQLLSIKNNVVFIPTWTIGLTTSGDSGMIVKRINAFSGAIMDGDDATSTKSASSLSDNTN